MTPAEAIGALDRQLARHGQKVTVRRYLAPSGDPRPKTELADINGFVRAVKADELVGDVKATSRNVTLSPTDILSLWPLDDSDKLVIDEMECAVQAVKPKFLNNELVRCDLVVMG